MLGLQLTYEDIEAVDPAYYKVRLAATGTALVQRQAAPCVADAGRPAKKTWLWACSKPIEPPSPLLAPKAGCGHSRPNAHQRRPLAAGSWSALRVHLAPGSLARAAASAHSRCPFPLPIAHARTRAESTLDAGERHHRRAGPHVHRRVGLLRPQGAARARARRPQHPCDRGQQAGVRQPHRAPHHDDVHPRADQRIPRGLLAARAAPPHLNLQRQRGVHAHVGACAGGRAGAWADGRAGGRASVRKWGAHAGVRMRMRGRARICMQRACGHRQERGMRRPQLHSTSRNEQWVGPPSLNEHAAPADEHVAPEHDAMDAVQQHAAPWQPQSAVHEQA
eukprot:354145-Chlamydomonas_euryale.AAC.4